VANVTVAEARAAVAKAERALVKAHPQFSVIVRQAGPCTIGTSSKRYPHFETLTRSIVYQQLAGAAASTIWMRVRALVEGTFTAQAVMGLSDDALRGAGLSNNKLLSVRDLAAQVIDGRLRLSKVVKLQDEEIISQLVLVRGIGRWTAEMFLMSQLGRLDVWPVGDLGVRNGFARLFGLDELPDVKELELRGEAFRPYRSVAAWYCWRATDTVDPMNSATKSRTSGVKVKNRTKKD
jgi:DNA-3-methyladenine glycosylase II